MKIDYKKKLPAVTVAIIIAQISTLVFALLSIANVFTSFPIYNKNGWVFSSLTEGSLGILMLFYGIDSFVYKKHKIMGSVFLLVSALSLFVMAFVIYVVLLKSGL